MSLYYSSPNWIALIWLRDSLSDYGTIASSQHAVAADGCSLSRRRTSRWLTSSSFLAPRMTRSVSRNVMSSSSDSSSESPSWRYGSSTLLLRTSVAGLQGMTDQQCEAPSSMGTMHPS